MNKYIYMAGIVDGEGSISIRRENPKGNYVYYRVTLRVTNTNKELIDWLQKTFNGTVHKRKNWKSCWKPCFEWKVYDSIAITIIKRILPYLIVKLQQASLAIHFQRAKSNFSQYFIKMKELNRRGISSVEVKEK